MSGWIDNKIAPLIDAFKDGRIRIETRGTYSTKPAFNGGGEIIHTDKRTYHIVIEPSNQQKQEQAEAEQRKLESDPNYKRTLRNLAEMSDDEYREYYDQPKHAHPAYDPKKHADYYRTRDQMKVNVHINEEL
jgi:hypothetical protein